MVRPRLDLKHFQVFVVLGDELHFGRAAEKLNMAQSQMSRAVRFIEDELGCVLLTRSTRNVRLTPAGENFLAQGRAVLELAQRATQTTRDVHEGIIGNVDVAYMDFAIGRSLPGVLRSFHQRFDRIKITLSHMWTEKQRTALLDQEVDLGFLIGPFENPEIRSIEVSRDRLMVVLPDTHVLANQVAVDLATLSDARFVFGHVKAWRPFRDVVEQACMEHGFLPQVVEEPFNSDAILGFVAAGLGVTLYPERPEAMLPRGVVVKPIAGVPRHVATIAAWHRRNPSGTLRNLVEVIADYSRLSLAETSRKS